MPLSPDRLTAVIGSLLSVLRLPTSTATRVLQWSGVAATVLLLVVDVLPPKWAAVALVAIAVLKAIQADLAQRSNPDGTPAQAPWDDGRRLK